MRFSNVLVDLSVYQATASDGLTWSLTVHSTAHIPRSYPRKIHVVAIVECHVRLSSHRWRPLALP
jgi:hypothetical protein